MLCTEAVSATWLVVGGLALRGSEGSNDSLYHGIPKRWTRHIPSGHELTAPLWYRHAFVQQLTKVNPQQDIGLHGGLTHFVWTDREATLSALRSELEAGLAALRELGIRPRSFSFPRNQVRSQSILAEYGFSTYRGRDPMPSSKFGRSLSGSVVRALEELGRFAPRPVWPMETRSGLWNIPASLFLYPISDSRCRFVPSQTRLARVKLGLEAAVRHRGVFHFCLHPANLAESPRGFDLFESILQEMTKARALGDVEILTMSQLAQRAATQTALEPSGQQAQDAAVELALSKSASTTARNMRMAP
jgi:hypothetical protein